MIRILLVDDQKTVREALKAKLELSPDLEVCGIASDGYGAIKQVKALQPDLVLIDLEMPGLDGISATRIIRQNFKDIKVLVLSVHDSDESVIIAMRAGAMGYLNKTICDRELIEAIRFAHKGYVQIGPGLLEKIISRGGESSSQTPKTISNETLDSTRAARLSLVPAAEAVSTYGGMTGATMTLAESPASSTPLAARTTAWSADFQAFLDRPPASLPRRLIVGGIAFCLVFGIMAWFGRVEEVGRATGQLVPKGETYKVEPIESGKVTRIAVKEGDVVEAGQVLVELDTELAKKEVERLEQILSAYQFEGRQKQDLLDRALLEAQTLKAIATEDAQEQRLAIAQAREKVATKRNLLTQLSSEIAAVRARKSQIKPLSTVAKRRLAQLDSEEAAHRERLKRLRAMQKEGAVSLEYIFQAEQSLRQVQQQIALSQLQEIANTDEQLFQAEQSLRELQDRMTQSQGELSASLKEAQRLETELNQKKAQGRKMLLEAEQRIQQLKVESAQIEAKIAETKNLLASERAKLKQRFFRAPVDGVVSRLNLKNAGEVVQPGEAIAEIAPSNAPLVLSAVLPDREAGFVKKGMPVKVKFNAYPFQDYGIISGKVVSISSDAEQNEQLGTVYRVKVELERNYVNEGRRTIRLKAGQTGSADIIIRRRRFADILFDPIRQLQRSGIDL
ncbi:response regulator containing a CheY-like receiver domain and an HTH DNA-binding domain [Pleurocapsa sp. PCC 7327]|uniref:response regulator n=1 Tax=Pleurocapsa sp. PCC 7327 TaxID=118163 RepID=UPI00029FA037|nr:response regulator [Pleurocapsa sp. PCC 7327]AFY75610.1 response regulator containing a CheY-like receiver domain and an HTH DNA-binding domain [Pleurocapsa sp. PCC 7327]